MNGTIAILGGCGGIGRVLVNNAVKIGYEVHVIDLPLKTIFRGVTPFLLADLVRLIVLILFPGLSLWLPSSLGWL